MGGGGEEGGREDGSWMLGGSTKLDEGYREEGRREVGTQCIKEEVRIK